MTNGFLDYNHILVHFLMYCIRISLLIYDFPPDPFWISFTVHLHKEIFPSFFNRYKWCRSSSMRNLRIQCCSSLKWKRFFGFYPCFYRFLKDRKSHVQFCTCSYPWCCCWGGGGGGLKVERVKWSSTVSYGPEVSCCRVHINADINIQPWGGYRQLKAPF